jgi:EAL domain-containing protein (putative c-di-GMP-specific phosphodiesterase class I)
VLDHALLQLAKWLDDPEVGAGLWVAVNVSAQQLAQPRFADRVAAAVVTADVPVGAVHLEFTESVLMDRIDHALRTVIELHKTGVKLSIDDFGTGYSSLSYLSRLPVDAIKIDRSFIRGMSGPGHDSSIVQSTIALAGTLGLEVVAEGVELPDQLTMLRRFGCGYAQGFLWSRPLTPAAVHSLLVERQLARTNAEAAATSRPAGEGGRSVPDIGRARAGEQRPVTDPANEVRYESLLIDLDARRVCVNGLDADLTKKEFDLLAFLAVHSGQVFSRSALLHEVWNSSPSWQTDSTVTEHVHRLRRRIEVDVARPRILRTVRGRGYCFGLPEPA